jgi:hypothetical protein
MQFRVPSVLALLLGVSAEQQPTRSFKFPFDTLDSAGKRTVPEWSVGGDAAINKGFVRLTTDRQSKSGFMWNSNPVGGQEFTTVLQFRISGQGARFFGDGIGMWLTSDSSYQNGMMHGVNEKFTGVGVVIDWGALGYAVEVSLRVTLDKTQGNAFDVFLKEAREVPEVIEVQTFLGRVDVRLSIIARDMVHYQQIYRSRILTLPHISEIEALMHVARIKTSEGLPL